MAVRNAYDFLAVNDPVPGGILVVEGWGPDFFLSEAVEEFRRGHYEGMFVTGGPIEKGSLFTEYKTYAQLAGASLLRMGMDEKDLHIIPADYVRKDRTYASAVALRNWLQAHHATVKKLSIMSMGPHSRRSRLLYEKAFGDQLRVGIVAVKDDEIDPKRWWATSQGFRSVTGEMIAYLYARFLFYPDANEPAKNP